MVVMICNFVSSTTCWRGLVDDGHKAEVHVQSSYPYNDNPYHYYYLYYDNFFGKPSRSILCVQNLTCTKSLHTLCSKSYLYNDNFMTLILIACSSSMPQMPLTPSVGLPCGAVASSGHTVPVSHSIPTVASL